MFPPFRGCAHKGNAATEAADGPLKQYNIEFLRFFVSLGGRRHQDGREDQKSKEQEDEMSFRRKIVHVYPISRFIWFNWCDGAKPTLILFLRSAADTLEIIPLTCLDVLPVCKSASRRS